MLKTCRSRDWTSQNQIGMGWVVYLQLCCGQGCPEGGKKKTFVKPTGTNVQGDAPCFLVMGSPLLQRLAVSSWRLVVGGGWRLGFGSWWRLAAVGDWRLVVGGGWRLEVGSSWRLVALGAWRLVVFGGCPCGLSLAQKKSVFSKTALVPASPAIMLPSVRQAQAPGLLNS